MMLSRHVSPHVASAIGADFLLNPDVPLNAITGSDTGELIGFMHIIDPYTAMRPFGKPIEESVRDLLESGAVKVHKNVCGE